MKSIFLFFLFFTCLTFADTPFKHELRFGYDFKGETTIQNSEFEHSSNFEISYEIYDEIINNLDFGLGITIRRESSAKNVTFLNSNSSEEKIANLIPIYGTFKYRFPMKDFSPFIKFNIGYSINHEQDLLKENDYETENSIYYALGAGIEKKNFIFDISYQITDYNIESANTSIEVENRKTTFSFGYQFE